MAIQLASVTASIMNSLIYCTKNVFDVMSIHCQCGIFGGFVGSREHFGMNYNADVRMPHDRAWIYNNGVSVAYLSFAEVDQYGNVSTCLTSMTD